MFEPLDIVLITLYRFTRTLNPNHTYRINLTLIKILLSLSKRLASSYKIYRVQISEVIVKFGKYDVITLITTVTIFKVDDADRSSQTGRHFAFGTSTPV